MDSIYEPLKSWSETPEMKTPEVTERNLSCCSLVKKAAASSKASANPSAATCYYHVIDSVQSCDISYQVDKQYTHSIFHSFFFSYTSSGSSEEMLILKPSKPHLLQSRSLETWKCPCSCRVEHLTTCRTQETNATETLSVTDFQGLKTGRAPKERSIPTIHFQVRTR